MIKVSFDLMGYPIRINYHPGKFGDHRHSDSGDIRVLVCDMISSEQLMKRSCDCMGRSLFKSVLYGKIWWP